MSIEKNQNCYQFPEIMDRKDFDTVIKIKDSFNESSYESENFFLETSRTAIKNVVIETLAFE